MEKSPLYQKRITVFGGSAPRPGQPAYEEAVQLGRILGQASCTVLTGGYIGTMEAVSRGAAEAGGHVVGITCTEIEAWRNVKCNAWVQEIRPYNSLRDRIMALVELSDAALALPGGAGTLAEVSLMWNHLITAAIPSRPLILIGAGWRHTFDTFFDVLGEYTIHKDRQHLSYAPSVEDAVARLVDSFSM